MKSTLTLRQQVPARKTSDDFIRLNIKKPQMCFGSLLSALVLCKKIKKVMGRILE